MPDINDFYNATTAEESAALEAQFKAEQAQIQAENDSWLDNQWKSNFGESVQDDAEKELTTPEPEKPNYLVIGLVVAVVGIGAILILRNINKAKQ